MARIKRPLFPIADNSNAISRDAKGDQIIFCAVGTSLSQSEVVLHRSSFITMTFNLNLYIRKLYQKGGISLQNLSIPLTDIKPVEIEIDVLNQFTLEVLPFDPRGFLALQTLLKFFLLLCPLSFFLFDLC